MPTSLVIVVVTFLLMWVLFILPQQRRVRAHQALVSRLRAGDEVMTTSGLYGRITSVNADVVTIEIAPGTVVRFARGAVARRMVEETGGRPFAPSSSGGSKKDDKKADTESRKDKRSRKDEKDDKADKAKATSGYTPLGARPAATAADRAIGSPTYAAPALGTSTSTPEPETVGVSTPDIAPLPATPWRRKEPLRAGEAPSAD